MSHRVLPRPHFRTHQCQVAVLHSSTWERTSWVSQALPDLSEAIRHNCVTRLLVDQASKLAVVCRPHPHLPLHPSWHLWFLCLHPFHLQDRHLMDRRERANTCHRPRRLRLPSNSSNPFMSLLLLRRLELRYKQEGVAVQDQAEDPQPHQLGCHLRLISLRPCRYPLLPLAGAKKCSMAILSSSTLITPHRPPRHHHQAIPCKSLFLTH